jgi:hypothetical protein
MKPGDIEVAEGKKTVYLTIGLFLREDGQIGISLGDEGITTVSNDDSSQRGHHNLFGHLKSILEKSDRWNPA